MGDLFDEAFHHAAADLAEAQEFLLNADPDDPRPRARALGLVLALKQPADDALRTLLGPLIPWFVARHPNDLICQMPPFSHLITNTTRDGEVAALWREHEAAQRLDAAGFRSAGMFFATRDWRLAERLNLRMGEFPGRSDDAFVAAGKLRAQLVRTESSEDMRSEHRRAAISHLGELATRSPPTRWSTYATKICAELCCDERDYEEAEQHARRALTLPTYGSPLHHAAETIIGRVAFAMGDVGTARAALERAGATEKDFVSSSYGPRLALAKALLAAGERDAVANYLRARAATWECGEGRAERWIAAIEAGDEPDWTDYHDHI